MQVAQGQASTPRPEPFLVQISDDQISLIPTPGPNNVTNCMVVYPDGRLYLELHRQEFGYGPASVAFYQGKLSAQELISLRAVLDSAAVRSLQAFPMPTLPMPTEGFDTFMAEIQRGRNAESRHHDLARFRTEKR
jgi:hypothetical protein